MRYAKGMEINGDRLKAARQLLAETVCQGFRYLRLKDGAIVSVLEWFVLRAEGRRACLSSWKPSLCFQCREKKTNSTFESIAQIVQRRLLAIWDRE